MAPIHQENLRMLRGEILEGPVGAFFFSANRNISPKAPAISAPVGPPPTMTEFSAPLAASEGSRSADSSMARMRERNRSASCSEYRGKLCSCAPGVPKKFGWEPAASTRKSP